MNDRTHQTQIQTAFVAAHKHLDELIDRACKRSGMSYETFMRCVTQNAFRLLIVWSESDLERLLLAAEKLGLSPISRELYGINREAAGTDIQIVVGLDGWVRLLNQHPAFDGMSFSESEQLEDGVPTWIECTIHRIDRRVPMTVKEYLAESKRETDAWTSHPRRMLRHRAIVQCARLALALPELVSLDDRVEPLDALNGTQGPKNEKEKLPVKQKAGPQASHGRNHSSTDQLIQIISCAP